MVPTTLAEKLAELLGLPVEFILAYGRPKTSVAFRRVRKPGVVIDTGGPSSRLMTLKDTEPQPAPIEAEKTTPTKTDENHLYAQWRDAPAEEKPELKEQLFNEVLKRARNVMWRKIPEADKNFARDIASVVIEQLAQFEGKSEFSTWVHRIILNHCNLYLRKNVQDKNRLYVSVNPEKDIKLKDPRAEAAFDRVDGALDAEPLEQLVETLPKKDGVLLDCMLDGITMVEAAEKLGVTEDAAESRWRRLKIRLRKKIRGETDGK
jgi:RNA polymerase sigma factor (sigma-70 family)